MRKFTFLIIAIVMSVLYAAAQSKTINGQVAADNGSPISGATVSVKGTSLSITINATGDFNILVPSTTRTLVIFALNFTTRKWLLVLKPNYLSNL